jgi:hypothetical protein
MAGAGTEENGVRHRKGEGHAGQPHLGAIPCQALKTLQ